MKYIESTASIRVATLLVPLLLFMFVAPQARAEWFVDQAAPAGGDGSAARPFQTIGQAVKALKGGQTVTVRQGVYRESVTISASGSAEAPTVLRAAEGQRVIVSGFVPVTDWKPAEGGVYTAVVEGAVNDLYVGYRPQEVARWPDMDQPMRVAASVDLPARTVRDAAAPGDVPALKALAGEVKSAMAFFYVASGNFYSTLPLAKFDPASGTLTLGPGRGAEALKGSAGRHQDRYRLANHPALIRRGGQWATEKLDEKRTRIHFRPAAPADLSRAQFRGAASHAVAVRGSGSAAISHVRIEGLEVCGSSRTGIHVERAGQVTVSRCVVHSNAGTGIWSRRSNDVRVANNLVMGNGNGVSVASAERAVIENNDVGMNLVDGIVAAGNVSGRPGGEPESRDVLLRRNYIHHHLYLGHPDNVQAYRGVKNLRIHDTLMLWAGQAIMTEEVDGGELVNSVAVGTGAVAVIFGHSNSHNWLVRGSTVGLGGWGAFSLTGTGYRLAGNIIWNNPLSLGPSTASDYNVYAAAREDQPVVLVAKPKWRSFAALDEAAKATGQEQHSLRSAPAFRNAPAFQAVLVGDDANAPGRLAVRLSSGSARMADFEVGDRVEINGDGVLRRVTAVEGEAIRFEPALPGRPFREGLIWNWKKADSPRLDLRPREGSATLKAAEGGTPAGADLDVAAYQRGDFDGDGKRDIPDVPADLKADLPGPNEIVVPLHGS